METWRPLGEMVPQWGLETPPLPPVIVEQQPLLEGGSEPAWEEREKRGLFDALFQTVQSVLFRPAETFSSMKQTGGLVNPLLYFVILSSAAFAVSALYQMAAATINPAFFTPQFQHVPKTAFSVVLIGTILISPALYVLAAFLSSGITHLALKILGGARRPFETTFRVICYAQASAAVLNILPLCGGLIAIVWAAFAIIIGLKEAHRIEAWRASLAFLLPGLLCCGFVVAPDLRCRNQHCGTQQTGELIP